MSNFSTKRRRIRLLATAAALSAVVCGLGALAYAGDKPPAQQEVGPEIGKFLQPAQQAIKEQRFADALARLGEADKVARKTPFEANLIRHLRAVAAIGSKNVAAAAAAVTEAIDARAIAAADQFSLTLAVAGLAFEAKDYPAAIAWASRLQQLPGGNSPQTRTLLIQSYYLSGDLAGAAREQLAEIADADKAGRPVAEGQLQLLASVQSRLNDAAGYLATLERLTTAYPKPAYWAELIQRVTARPGFSRHLRLEVLRLRHAAGVLAAPAEHVELIEAALRAGAAGEAKAVAEQGLASGALGSGPEGARHRRLADLATRAAAEEAAALPVKEAAAGTGPALAGVAAGYLAQGQAAKAAALLEQAISVGGIKSPEEARLNLALAQRAAGLKDQAVKTLKAVSDDSGAGDGTGALARLWLIRVAQS